MHFAFIWIAIFVLACKTASHQTSLEQTTPSLAAPDDKNITNAMFLNGSDAKSKANTLPNLSAGSDIYIANPPWDLMHDLGIYPETAYTAISTIDVIDELDEQGSQITLVHLANLNSTQLSIVQKYAQTGNLQISASGVKETGLNFVGEFFSAVYEKIGNYLNPSFFSHEDVTAAESAEYISKEMSEKFRSNFGKDISELDGEETKRLFLKRFNIKQSDLKTFQNIKELNYTNPKNTREAYYILPSSDYNGAFANSSEARNILALSLDHNIRIIRADDAVGLKKDIDKLIADGKRIDFISLAGHGSPEDFELNQILTRKDFAPDAPLTQSLDRLLKKDAVIALQACSTGEYITASNLAESIAQSLKRTVIAPMKNAAAGHTFLISPNKLRYISPADKADMTLTVMSTNLKVETYKPSILLEDNILEAGSKYLKNTNREKLYVKISLEDMQKSPEIVLKNLKELSKSHFEMDSLLLANLRYKDVESILNVMLDEGFQADFVRIEGISFAGKGSDSSLLSAAEFKFSASMLKDLALIGGHETLISLDVRQLDNSEGHLKDIDWEKSYENLERLGIDADSFLINPPKNLLKELKLYGIQVSGTKLRTADGKFTSLKNIVQLAPNCETYHLVAGDESDVPAMLQQIAADSSSLNFNVVSTGRHIFISRN